MTDLGKMGNELGFLSPKHSPQQGLDPGALSLAPSAWLPRTTQDLLAHGHNRQNSPVVSHTLSGLEMPASQRDKHTWWSPPDQWRVYSGPSQSHYQAVQTKKRRQWVIKVEDDTQDVFKYSLEYLVKVLSSQHEGSSRKKLGHNYINTHTPTI